MVKRRRLWGRFVLSCIWIFLAATYCCLMIAIGLIGNSDLSYQKLRLEMKDNSPPVIEMRGGESLTIAVNDRLVEPGITVYDESSIPSVEVQSDVNVSVEGDYQIRYTATDEAGNSSESSRTVKVIQPIGRIYLTFDDGPSEFTNQLLDVLKKYNTKATFFVTGYGDDDVIKREYEEGHTVGLHSMSHNYSHIYSSKDNYWSDLNAIQERVQRITGQKSFLMRFPGGSSNLISSLYDNDSGIMSALADEVTKQNYVYFDWNIDSDDAGAASSADQVYNNVVGALGMGGEYVILQHDVKPYSVDAVERIIQYGLDRGFLFDRLSTTSFNAHHKINN